MAKSVDLIATGIGARGKVAAKDSYDTSFLPSRQLNRKRGGGRLRLV